MGIKETKVYSINDFLQWERNNELFISPKYQRKSVWNEKAKSYLIDTILRGLPVPQVFLRQKIDTELSITSREVIDGQQRLRAIISFFKNEFAVKKIHNKEFGGKFYKDLSEEEKIDFLDYQLPVELIKSPDDNVVYDMFMRVNTNSIVLNKQELRNAKYWGDLKVLAYNLSSKWRFFFSEYNIIKDKDIIRMYDVEFVSRLLRILIEGVTTDTPAALDKFYEKYETLDDLDSIEAKFNSIFDDLNFLFSNELFNIHYFDKPNYLYTLFAFLVDNKYGINNFERKYVSKDIENLKEKIDLETFYIKLEELESLLLDNTTDILIEDFIDLHIKRTTNEKERSRRINMFADYIYESRFISSYE